MSAGQLMVLIGLGVFHGLNPAMGWPAAVARGLQEGGRRALLAALPAIAGGHAAAVAVTALAITVTGSAAASRWFPVGGGALVAVTGLVLLLRRRHGHGRELRVPLGHLAVWSFVMSSLHGAGLMLLPVLAGRLAPAPPAVPGHHGADAAVPPAPGHGHAVTGRVDLWDATVLGLGATAVHTAAMIAAAAVIALVVHDFFGVNALRVRWVTMDRVWALALVAGGLFAVWGAV